jgi:predicted kinase
LERGLDLPNLDYLNAVTVHPAALAAGAPDPERWGAIENLDDFDVRLLVDLDLVPARQADNPTLLVVAGLPASGKSYFARTLQNYMPSLAHVSSDMIRKALTAGSPTYADEENRRTHTTVARLATRLLRAGYSVALDATGVRPRDRRSALEAAGGTFRTGLAWCEVNEEIAHARLAARDAGADPYDHSDATYEIRTRMAGVTTVPAPGEASFLVLVRPDTFDAAVVAAVAFLNT